MFVQIGDVTVNLSQYDYWKAIVPPKGDVNNASNTNKRIAFYKDGYEDLGVPVDDPQDVYDSLAEYCLKYVEE